MKPTQPTLRAVHESRHVTGEIAEALGLETTWRRTRMSRRIDNAWIEVPLGAEWIAAYRLATSGGKPVVAELRIFPADDLAGRPQGEWSGVWLGVHVQVPRHGLTGRIVSRVRVHRHLAELPAILAYFAAKGIPQEPLSRFGLSLPPARVSGRGRKRLPDEFLARVASVYASALSAGSKHPLRDVAERHNMPIAVVRGWIHKARGRGLLIGGAWGKAAGILSPVAALLLQRDQRPQGTKKSDRPTRQLSRRK